MPPERLADDVSTPGAPFVTAIRWHAEQDPDRIAVTGADGSLTRGDLDAGAHRLRLVAGFGATSTPSIPAGFVPDQALDDGPLPVVVSNRWKAPAAIAGRRPGTS